MTPKLIDDCFRTDARDAQRLTHERTLELIRERVKPVVGVETVPLGEVLGRIVARDVSAPISVPSHTNSAVDGYAIAEAGRSGGERVTLPVSARIAAGGTVPDDLDAATAIRVFTGAVVPPPFDTVVMQEDCDVDAGRVIIPAGVKPGQNVRQAGEDVARGARIVAQGDIVRAPEIAALASLGVGEIEVFKRPRVGLIATGDEVRRGGGALRLGEVHDVNTPLLKALLAHTIAMPEDLGVWPDRRDEVIGRLEAESRRFDLLITSGGASQGEEDHMSHALAALGSRHFWQIAVKPGRPLMMGQIGNTAAVGLPGNPVAVFVCFLMYVYPLIRQLGGGSWRVAKRYRLPADFAFAGRKVGRREFWRGTMKMTDDGPVVVKFPRDGSGLISSLRAANGLIDIPEEAGDVVPGQIVDFIPFSEFGIVD